MSLKEDLKQNMKEHYLRLYASIQVVLRKSFVRFLCIFFIAISIAAIIISSFVGKSYQLILFGIIFISSIFFAIEYIFRLLSAPAMHPEQSFLKSRIAYAFSFYGIIDFIAMLPSALAFPYIGTDVAHIVILPYVLTIFKLIRYSRSFRMIGEVLEMVKDELVTAYSACCILITFSAILMYHVEHRAQPEAFSNIGDSFWWAVVTFTTVGYGDIYPITPLGKILGGVISMIGIAMIAIPTGIISSAFINIMQRKKNQKLNNTDDVALQDQEDKSMENAD